MTISRFANGAYYSSKHQTVIYTGTQLPVAQSVDPKIYNRAAYEKRKQSQYRKREKERHEAYVSRFNNQSGIREVRKPMANTSTKYFWQQQDTAENTEDIATIARVLRERMTAQYMDFDSKGLRVIEGIGAYLGALYNTKNITGFVCTTTLYLQTLFDGAVTEKIKDYILDIFVENQSGEIDGNDSPKWLDMFKDLRDNWVLLRNNKLFPKISKLLSVLVAAGMCKATDLEFKLGNFEVISARNLDQHMNAFDVIDAVLGTVVSFCEGMYHCFVQGSIKPLIIGDGNSLKLDEEYALIQARWDLVKNGNLHLAEGITDNEFVKDLEKLTNNMKMALVTLRGPEKTIMTTKYGQLIKMRNEFTILKMNGGMRIAPFGIELYGGSAQGKSSLCEIIIQAIMVANDLPTDAEFRGIINPADKFMSNWDSHKLIAIFDDFCNEKSEHVERPPSRLLIEMMNNMMSYANKAEVEGKGKCYMSPLLAMVTTNKKDLDAASYSNNPYSVQRRMDAVITVEARPEVQRMHGGKLCGMDSAAVQEYMQKQGYSDDQLEDIWLLTVEKAVMPSKEHQLASYAPVEWRGMTLKHVSVFIVLEYLVEQFSIHLAAQKAMVKRDMAKAKRIVKCGVDGCCAIRGCCKDHSREQSMFEANKREIAASSCVECRIDMDDNEKPLVSVTSPPLLGMSTTPELKDEVQEKLKILREEYSPPPEVIAEIESASDDEWEEETIYDEDEDVPDDLSTDTPDVFVNDDLDGENDDDLDEDDDAPDEAFLPIHEQIALRNQAGVRDIARTVQRNVRTFVQRPVECMVPTAGILTTWRNLNLAQSYLDLVPDEIYEFSWVQNILLWRHRDMVFSNIKFYCYTMGGFLMFFAIFCPWQIALLWLMWCIVDARYVVWRASGQVLEELALRRDTMRSLDNVQRTEALQNLTRMCAGVGLMYTALKIYQSTRTTNFPVQSRLEPASKEDIDDRDSDENPWALVEKRELPKSHETKCTTLDVLSNVVEKNLYYCEIDISETKVAIANVLFLRSNLLMIPSHYFNYYGSELKCRFKRGKEGVTGSVFRGLLTLDRAYNVPGTDYSICYIANGGSFRNLIKHFPDHPPDDIGFHMLYRDGAGEMIVAKGRAHLGNVQSDILYRGYQYTNLSMLTFEGLCGATLLSHSKGSQILGMHLCGHTDTPRGNAGIILQRQIEQAIEYLSKKRGVVFTGQATTFRENVLGKQITQSGDIHPKSPLNYLPNQSQISYYGRCVGMSSSKSNVKPTLISKYVDSICGVPNKWQAPKMKPEYFGWQKCLAELANPGTTMPNRLMDKAIADYLEPLKRLAMSDHWRGEIRTLTTKETLCGIKGKRFVDAMKLSTSIGYPLSGPKSKFVVELEPTEDFPCNRELVPEIMSDIDWAEEEYAKGNRVFAIAKACKKDEVLDKEKCRIFYSNPIILIFLIRKYFLTTSRFLQMNPKIAECAVGINCHSPEWEELNTFMETFGTDRTFAGDYGKYDQHLPAQHIIAAMYILIELHWCVNRDTRARTIMESIVGDLVYPFIAVNGDLISLHEGGHISGNPLTVIINSIAGSLNLRCFFFELYPYKVFREHVKIVTYGDDNKGSVSPDCPEFNIKNFSTFLSKYGQVYTMPDKESELQDYMESAEAEFLKRNSVYHEKLGVVLGALAEDSIFKSLHMYLRPSDAALLEEEACAENIDGALREWFNHGEEIYEKRRKEMQVIAAEADIIHLCRGLDKSYADLAREWKEKYQPLEASSPGGAGC